MGTLQPQLSLKWTNHSEPKEIIIIKENGKYTKYTILKDRT